MQRGAASAQLMGLSLGLIPGPRPAVVDLVYNGLPSGVHVDVLYGDLLLALVAVLPESLHLHRKGAGELGERRGVRLERRQVVRAGHAPGRPDHRHMGEVTAICTASVRSTTARGAEWAGALLPPLLRMSLLMVHAAKPPHDKRAVIVGLIGFGLLLATDLAGATMDKPLSPARAKSRVGPILLRIAFAPRLLAGGLPGLGVDIAGRGLWRASG